jgi:hypothetical protein
MEALRDAKAEAGRMLTSNAVLDIVAGSNEGLPDPNELHALERPMNGGGAWQGNIKARLYERVRARGYNSLTAFADARPTVRAMAALLSEGQHVGLSPYLLA